MAKTKRRLGVPHKLAGERVPVIANQKINKLNEILMLLEERSQVHHQPKSPQLISVSEIFACKITFCCFLLVCTVFLFHFFSFLFGCVCLCQQGLIRPPHIFPHLNFHQLSYPLQPSAMKKRKNIQLSHFMISS